MDIFGYHLDFNGKLLFIVHITIDYRPFWNTSRANLNIIHSKLENISTMLCNSWTNVEHLYMYLCTVENSRVLSNGCGSVRKVLNAMESFFMSHINRRNDWPKNVNLLALWTDLKDLCWKKNESEKNGLKLKPQITLWTWFLTLKYIVAKKRDKKCRPLSSLRSMEDIPMVTVGRCITYLWNVWGQKPSTSWKRQMH